MGKSLVIAEKPSVAADLARALGKLPKKDDYFENDQFVITSAVGHLVELCLPTELEKKRGKWSFANLPVIPSHFELKPIEKTVARFKLILKLLKRKDIEEVINACDAGREGELIFRYLMQLAASKKPTRRLWLQSMTPEAIRNGFQHLRKGQEMRALGDAAVCRSESDWLVGINGTRAMTAFNSKLGGFQLTPVGRVQTPTLAILVEREEKIRSFQPRTYFEVHAQFNSEQGEYSGRWVDPSFKKGTDEDGRAERLWEKEKAEAIRLKCQGKRATVSEEKKPASQSAPLLYDLTSLQREANSRFSLSARRTLQIAQALYERHKVLTYPRTDSRYLPKENLASVRSTLESLANPELRIHAAKALEKGWVKLLERVFNNAKVTDHHAIIPTPVASKNLDEIESKIYDMVVRRFIAAFYPHAQFQVTVRLTTLEGEIFRTDGKTIVEPGWLAVYGKQNTGEEILVPLREGETPSVKELEVRENQTKPPPRYSEATLLSAMEGAGKLLEDEELRDAMRQRGLGTPATRAQIIEGLIADGYILRQGRELVGTSKGIALTTLLRGIGIEALCSPELTGEWEYKLKQMEAGEIDREMFMNEIRSFTQTIVEKAKSFSGDSVEGNFHDLEVKCPKCQTLGFKESFRAYECKGCGLLLWKNVAGRQFEPEEIRALLETGSVGPLEGFRSKMGRPFTAKIKLGEDFKPGFDFDDSAESLQQVDFSTMPMIGTCPICRIGTVYDIGTAYCCSEVPSKKCTLRIGKIILQKEIPAAQISKLLESGKTDLLPRFISKKGRPFSAHLVLKNGKVGFEFQERKKGASSVSSKSR
jgi:DNA topoisomerase-3